MAIFCLCGCRQEGSIPSDSFQLAVREVIADTDIKVTVLAIRTSVKASISVDSDSSHNHVALPEAPPGEPREGDIFISGVRIAWQPTDSAYIQTLIRPRVATGFAGGPHVYPVPSDTTLEGFFKITAASGVYKLDSPIPIAKVRDKPVTLVVGKPTK